MEYIIISTLTIFLFTYIVYLIANKVLAIQIHIKSLILCACCALLISLILPRLFVGFFGIAGTLCIIIVFAIISSYFIAHTYDNAMQKAIIADNRTNESQALTELLETDAIDSSLLKKILIEMTEPTEDNSEYDKNLVFLKRNVTEETSTTKTLEEEAIPEIIVEAPEEEAIPEIIVEAPEEEAIPEIIVEAPEEEAIPEIIVEAPEEEAIPKIIVEAPEEEVIPEIIVEAPEEEAIPEIIVEAPEEEAIPEIIVKAPEEEVMPEVIVKIEEKVEVLSNFMNVNEQNQLISDSEISNANPENIVLPLSKDLDDLMDFAFLQKERREFVQALTTFRQALLLYPDSEASPFLVMEIGTILKNLGSYNESITVFTEGRLLPRVTSDSMLEQEFINNIAYLRVVKNILIKNSLEFMPFSRIPEKVLKEIDDEFSEWRNQS